MPLETKRVLVTVKTYPNPSRKYGETVCVAGIDLATEQWIRLYPIPFRDLDEDKKFRKYAVIEVKAEKASGDSRPESFKVDTDSIKLLEHIDTKKSWARRKEIVMPTLSSSFCEILNAAKSNLQSLGMFKPNNIKFSFEKAPQKDEIERAAYYAQLGFYNKKKKVIEAIPFVFRYSFTCHGTSVCEGHTLPIIDWELGQSYRAWRNEYKSEELLLEKIEEKWLGMMCSEKKDTYFFVGNWKQFRENFMVLGVFYPPAE